MTNTEKTSFFQGKTKRIIEILLIAGIIGCLVLLLRPVRSIIILFGEKFIVHRSLAAAKWHKRFIKWALEGMFLIASFWWLFYLSKNEFYSISKKVKKYITLPIFVIILFFLFELICLTIINNSVWFDEAFSLALIRHPWTEVIKLTAIDVHPPLYYLILKLFRLFFGESVFVMKISSMLPILLTLCISVSFLRKNIGDKSALFFLLTYMTSYKIMYYSIEIRMYALALFFSTMSAIALWYALTTEKTKYYALFLLFALGAAYTHYYTAILEGIVYLLLFIYTIIYNKKQIKTVLLIAVFALIFYSPWVIVLVKSFSRLSTFNNNRVPYVIQLKNVYTYIRDIFMTVPNKYHFTTILILLFSISIIQYLAKRNKVFNDHFFFSLFCCTIGFMSVGIVSSFFITHKFLSFVRYFIPSCGFMWMFFAFEFGSMRNNRIWALFYILLLYFNIQSFIYLYSLEKRSGQEYEKFYKYISKNIDKDDIFIISPNVHGHIPWILAYLFPGHIIVADKEQNEYYHGVFLNVFKREEISYDELPSKKNRKWVFLFDDKDRIIENNYIPNFGIKAVYQGSFEWDMYQYWYKFKLFSLF